MEPKDIKDRFLAIEETLKALMESEKSCGQQVKELTAILQGLGAKKEVIALAAEPTVSDLVEETPPGGDNSVPDVAKETSDTSFAPLKRGNGANETPARCLLLPLVVFILLQVGKSAFLGLHILTSDLIHSPGGPLDQTFNHFQFLASLTDPNKICLGEVH